jgi:hypothetical protein
VRAVTYEWRRLVGVRSTWLILLTVLAVQAALDLVTVRHPMVGSDAPLRMLIEAVPVLPLPTAALGAGALGALAIGQELRHPALRPLVARRWRRMRVLVAKLVVNAGVAVLLGAGTVVLGLALLRFGRPGGRAVIASLGHGEALLALAGYLALVVVSGTVSVLAAGVCRGAAAGMLVLVTGSVLAQALVGAAYDRARAHGWLRGRLSGLRALHDTAELSPALLAAAVTVPALVLLCAYGALLLRRRGL